MTRRHTLPGLPLALSITTTAVFLFVIVPLTTILSVTARVSSARFIAIALNPRTLAAYRLSLLTSIAAAVLATALGLLLAWVLTRYTFPGRRVLDALIDLPVALPTAVLGLALATADISGPGGIALALTVLGLPLVVRAVAPSLATAPFGAEEASAVLGASPWQTFVRITLPTVAPALVTGAALTFARAVGEYGCVVFIAGNMPFRTEIAPVLIMTRIEEFDDSAATAVATVLLGLSLGILLLLSRFQRWTTR